MFSVEVCRMPKFSLVVREEIETLPELKSFLYSVREARDLHATAYGPNREMIVQESGQPLRTWAMNKSTEDVQFLNRLKKSTYHPEGKMIS
jgi:hypothetical protein